MTKDQEWVLLAYRLPRVPSTPRSAIWRKLKRLGVVQLADGLVALPADRRTREQLEWIADDVVDHGGEALLWLGRPADSSGQAGLAAQMNATIVGEYAAVIAAARVGRDDDAQTRRRVVARLRRELHRIEARDFFSPPQREQARRAVEELGALEAAKAHR
ncbi:MAG: Chromate resistance protein ChrB [Mycobacteriales bacterium]